MAKIKYHFPRNNVTVEVDSLEQLKTVSKAFGEEVKLDKTYASESKGLIFIKDMDIKHIMRVIRKRTTELLDAALTEGLGEVSQNAAIAKFIGGYVRIPEDKLLSDLMSELSERHSALSKPLSRRF